MKSKKYLNIAKHYEACLKTYGDNHKGVDWPKLKDVRTRYQIMLGLIKEKNTPVTLLDFGCGAGHLFEYIQNNTNILTSIAYTGVDISDKFITLCKQKYPDNSFYCMDILENNKHLEVFDYAILNGVFTEKRDLSFDEMWIFFKEVLITIFNKIEKGVAFNVMSKAVDWERDDLFHLPTDMLIEFLTKNLSRNFVLRNDYGLYEYTVYLYK